MILGADWVLPIDGEPIAGGAVRVDGGTIAEVGTDLEPDERFGGCAILPGLVNAHSHLEYAGMSGFGDGRPFDGWIADHIRRREGLVREDYLAQARAGVAESLAGGVTTIADCCYAGTVAEAAEDGGIRAVVYLEAFSRHDVFDIPLERRLDEVESTELVTIGVSPHAPYTVDLEDYRRWIAVARDRGIPVATHLLEGNLDEHPAAYFRDVLGPDTAVIHAVKADAADIAVFAELDVPVVHCPRSNALLGCGIAPVPALREAGVRVALGTDSPASALTLDMWDEMRAAVLLARAGVGRPDVLTAGDVLRMATADGAAALGLTEGLGTLQPGAPADLIVLDLNGSPFLPWDDPEAAAVYGGTPDRVALSMVAGRIRFRAGGAPTDTSLASGVRARMIDA
jgi:5-methylthioadenosine/S-adenosylhomocysteine deaminase